MDKKKSDKGAVNGGGGSYLRELSGGGEFKSRPGYKLGAQIRVLWGKRVNGEFGVSIKKARYGQVSLYVYKNKQGNYDTSKRWYIYFHFLDAKTNKMKLVKRYLGLNRIKDPKKRLNEFLEFVELQEQLLAAGWSPFGDHDIHYKINSDMVPGLDECFDTFMNKHFVNGSGLKNKKTLTAHISKFVEYVNLKFDPETINDVNKAMVLAYLDTLQGKAAKTRNNYLASINTFFNTLIYHDILGDNPCKGIKRLKEVGKTHQPYNFNDLIRIRSYLERNDPYLLLFAQFIAYCGLRPVEIRRLKVSSIDTKRGVIYPAGEDLKQRIGAVKRIPEFFLPKIKAMGLSQYPGHYFVFTINHVPAPSGMYEDYMTERFRQVRKKLNIGSEYTLYGFRHTFLGELLRNGMSATEVMKVSGHSTLASFQAYVKKYLLELPPDISEYLNIKI